MINAVCAMLQELFLVQLAALLERYQNGGKESSPCLESVQVGNLEAMKTALQVLPYELTPSQKEVLKDILRDLRGPEVTMRLLQGDVGCGKTVVALLAMTAAAGSGGRGGKVKKHNRHQQLCALVWLASLGLVALLLKGAGL